MKKVRHIVSFKYSEGASAEHIQQVTDALAALTKKIPGIKSFEHGVNNSPEGKSLGFTHVYQFTFVNAAARDTYLTHPAHKEFLQFLNDLGIFQNALVLDYQVVLRVDNTPYS